MKKLLKILLYIILAFVVIIIVAPILFKGKIITIAKEQINKQIDAKVEFTDLRLSLIKNFPNFSVTLEGLCISGVDHFEKDTLLKLKSFMVSVDLISALQMDNIKVKKILIDNPVIAARINQYGEANWDIMKETEKEEEEVTDTAAGEFSTKIALKKFEIREAYISFEDDSSHMDAALNNFNFILKGDLAQDFTMLDLSSSIAEIVVSIGGIKYLNNASFGLDMAVDANLEEQIYVLKENNISLNDISLGLIGSISMPDSNTTSLDIKFATKKTSFKSLLSLIPAIYKKDFERIKTDGKLTLQGVIKGDLTATTTPSATVHLLVENAMFKYPELPKEANQILIDLRANYDGVNNDNTTVNLSRFHVELGGNPVDAILQVKTPISDPFAKGKVTMAIDLATLSDVVPLENTTIKGKINSDLAFEGNMSTIENERYEDFKASGTLGISDFLYTGPNVPKDIHIVKTALNFTPKYVALNAFDAQIGESDFHLTGKIENFFPYVFSDGTIKGAFDFSSGLVNVNEFLTETETEAEEEVVDTTPISVVEVPKNIDFVLNSRLKKVYYDKLEIDNLVGLIQIQEGIVNLHELSMNTLDGSVKLSGLYSSQDVENPFTELDIRASQIDIPQAVKSLSSLEKMAPIAKRATGKISIDLAYNGLLDEHMSPMLNTVEGHGRLKSQQIGLSGSKTLEKINEVMKLTKKKDITLNDLDIQFDIKEGRIYVKPFDTKMGSTIMNIGGDQGLDQTMNYTVKMDFPRTGMAKTATDGIFSLAKSQGIDLGQSDRIKMDFLVTGTFTDPKVKPLLMGGSEDKKVTTQVKEKAEEVIKKEVEKKKEEVKKAASAEADKLIADAEKEADKIRAEAKKLADETRAEADRRANQVIKEAKNPIAKRAAEPLARKIRSEGEAAATKIEDEANAKANAVIERARKEADKLK